MFKADHGIVFDPVTEVGIADWNDPHPRPPGRWACWLRGCTVDSVYGKGVRFAAAGLQSLVTTIRRTGATQPIVLGGIDYNADLTRLLDHLPKDPVRQLVASAHVYDFVQGAGVGALFRDQLEPIARRLPVIIGELGERKCDSGSAVYTHRVLGLVDAERRKGNLIGVLGWTWNARSASSGGWRCPTAKYGDGGPLLIRDYAGTPTVLGRVLRAWIASARTR